MELLLPHYRKINGMTQTDLAREIGTTRRVISAYERGETPVPLDVACAICDVLHITLDELAGREMPRAYADQRQQRINDSFIELSERGKAKLAEHAEDLLSAESFSKNEEGDSVSESA